MGFPYPIAFAVIALSASLQASPRELPLSINPTMEVGLSAPAPNGSSARLVSDQPKSLTPIPEVDPAIPAIILCAVVVIVAQLRKRRV